jgi:phosphatidylglycerophosphate synthase
MTVEWLVNAVLRLPVIDLITLVLLPAVWILAVGIFGVRSALFGMPRTARIDHIAQSPYLPRFLMEFGYWMFTLPVELCVRLGISANMITIGSMLLSIGAAISFGIGQFGIGSWLLFFAFTCDAWDGIVARKTNTSSITGEFFDATIDRYNDLIVFLGLMYYYRNDGLPLALASLAMIGSTLVSYTRAKGEAVGIDPNVGYMQRHERAVYLGSCTLFSPLLAAWIEPGVSHPRYHLTMATLALIAILTNVTAIWRFRYVLAGLREREKARARTLLAADSLEGERELGEPQELARARELTEAEELAEARELADDEQRLSREAQ